MALPYRWHPSNTRMAHDIEAGMLWPHEHEVYRIIEVNPVPEDRWTGEDRAAIAGYKPEYQTRFAPRMVVVRPVNVTSTDVRARDHDKHFRMGGARPKYLDVYTDEHYPICAECREPLPCRDQMAERISALEITKMARYEMAGVCPSCSEPVTARQKSTTWPDNAIIPQGPPVTFHMRARCRYGAVTYEKRWVALDPERRRTLLSCKGGIINHNDGTYQCTELTECPGPVAQHQGHAVCRCPDCHARGSFDCFPSPNSRNQALDGEQ
jgi:hypothetical protein